MDNPHFVDDGECSSLLHRRHDSGSSEGEDEGVGGASGQGAESATTEGGGKTRQQHYKSSTRKERRDRLLKGPQGVESEEEEEERRMAPHALHGHGHSHSHSHSHHSNGGDVEEGSISSITSGGSGHCHDDLLIQQEERRAEKVLWVVACLSLVFISIEATGGFLAGSLAIITDAGHLLSDLLSFIISIVAIRTARHPASKRLSFGYHRAEILGATISIVILWVLTTVLVLLAIERIVENKLDVEANTMLITAGCGVIFNIVMAIVLHVGSKGSHGHSHSGLSHAHAHSHSSGSEDEEEHTTRRNVNVRAAFVHVVGDLVQSVGVLIAALVIKFTGWDYADPICTFVFSIIVLFTTITVLRDIFYVLMEATPPHIDYSAVRADLMKLENVAAVHDLHVWSLNMEKAALSVHLAIVNCERALDTVAEARQMLLKKYSVQSVTIQVEAFDKSMDSCKKCQPV